MRKMRFNTIFELSTQPKKGILQARLRRSWLATNPYNNYVLHKDLILLVAKMLLAKWFIMSRLPNHLKKLHCNFLMDTAFKFVCGVNKELNWVTS
ncbi:hypothetical protein LINPERPRIM_LOCUS25604 [Linum perenne]